jgi:hypothetical protein
MNQASFIWTVTLELSIAEIFVGSEERLDLAAKVRAQL